jgi:chorismate mutase
VGELKQKRGQQIYDPAREKEILAKQLATARMLMLDETFVREMCTAIFHLAKATQVKMNTRRR